MQVIRGLANLPRSANGRAVTIGNFDGVHLGHQQILAQLRDAAQSRDLDATLVTFEPHPREFLAPEQTPARLTRIGEKLRLLKEQDLACVLVLPFNRKLASLPAVDFVEQVMVSRLETKFLLIGDDFRFGQGGEGNFALLRSMAAANRFDINRQMTIEVDGERVSSTRIREALANGDFDAAAALLGRRYRISGRVAYGQQLGRTIGFPTANLPMRRKVSALRGVFAVLATVDGVGERLPAVANVGIRPTVGGVGIRLEVHCFDLDANLYGRMMHVEPVARIREEKKFDSLDELKAQIARDAEQARQLLLG